MIKLPIKVGDTILGGKFKNMKVKVKDIGKNEKGDITINGKPLLRFRIPEEPIEEGMITFNSILLLERSKYDLPKIEAYFNECLDKYFPDGWTYRPENYGFDVVTLPTGYRQKYPVAFKSVVSKHFLGDFDRKFRVLRIGTTIFSDDTLLHDTVFHEAIHYIESVIVSENQMTTAQIGEHKEFFQAQMNRINKGEGRTVVSITGKMPEVKVKPFFVYLAEVYSIKTGQYEKRFMWSPKQFATQKVISDIELITRMNGMFAKLTLPKTIVKKLVILQNTSSAIPQSFKRSVNTDSLNMYNMDYPQLEQFKSVLDSAPTLEMQ